MSLTQIVENTFFANGRYWGKRNSSLWHHGSVWAMDTGIESADLNLVWNEKPLAARDCKTIQEIKGHFRSVGLPFWWWVFPSGQSRITVDMLKAEGFSLVDSIPSMVADLKTNAASIPQIDDMQIIRVRNREELCLWEDASFRGFEFSPKVRRQYSNFVNTFNIRPDSPQKFFLACLKGRPVASALLFLYKNTGGIYFVSTLPEHRKKGIGLAVTRAAMQFAGQAGAEYCTLQSSTAGLRVYRQAGFTEFCSVDVYCLKQ
jgi:ribosomal protein S18 acetylase RimI-like enzyme